MPIKGPLDLLCQMAEILDELQVPYALGGSMASSLLGEPRTTIDGLCCILGESALRGLM